MNVLLYMLCKNVFLTSLIVFIIIILIFIKKNTDFYIYLFVIFLISYLGLFLILYCFNLFSLCFITILEIITILFAEIVYVCIAKKINESIDVLIVLGCRLTEKNHVSPNLELRLKKAIEVYTKLEFKPLIIVSGGKPHNSACESTVMKNYLVKNGIPESKILCEKESNNTFQNLLYTKSLIDKHKKNAIISSYYHLPRIYLYANKLKFTTKCIPCKSESYRYHCFEFVKLIKLLSYKILISWMLLNLVLFIFCIEFSF